MLDLKELERKFDEILYSFTREDLENWLRFAEEREQRERLEKFLEGNLPLNIVSVKISQRNFVGDISIQGLDNYNPDYAEAA